MSKAPQRLIVQVYDPKLLSLPREAEFVKGEKSKSREVNCDFLKILKLVERHKTYLEKNSATPTCKSDSGKESQIKTRDTRRRLLEFHNEYRDRFLNAFHQDLYMSRGPEVREEPKKEEPPVTVQAEFKKPVCPPPPPPTPKKVKSIPAVSEKEEGEMTEDELEKEIDAYMATEEPRGKKRKQTTLDDVPSSKKTRKMPTLQLKRV